MKIFETVLKQLESNGFKENQCRLNRQQLMLGLKTIVMIATICVNLFYEADAPEEYMSCIFHITISILVFISRISSVFKTATIFIFIKKFNQMINQSE